MIKCPYCSFENIEGVDDCEQCRQPLNDSHLKDPVTALERGILYDAVAVLPAKDPVIVERATAVGDVIALIAEKGTGCAFVAETSGKLVGVFSERDALYRIGSRMEELASEPVSSFMSPNPQCLRSDAKIGFAVQQMDVGHFRHIPILDESETAVGVISVREILGYLTDKSAER